MLAILALICFVLAALGKTVIGTVVLLPLGLAFLAAHFVLGGWPWGGNYPWQRRG
jgi:hypothetical protein